MAITISPIDLPVIKTACSLGQVCFRDGYVLGVCQDLQFRGKLSVPFEGAVAFDAELLAKVIEPGEISLEGKVGPFDLLTFPAEDFPKIDFDLEAPPLVVPAKELQRVLSAALVGVPKKDPRRILFCVRLEITSDGVFVGVGTDGKKLICARGTCLEGQAAEINLPERTARAVLESLGEVDQVTIRASETAAVIEMGQVEIRSQLQSNYPDWRKVIPGKAGEAIDLDKAPLLAALKRANLIDTAARLRFQNGGCEVSARCADRGTFWESFAVGKGELSFSVDAKILKEVVCAFSEPRCEMRGTKPIIFDFGDLGFGLVMPILEKQSCED